VAREFVRKVVAQELAVVLQAKHCLTINV